MQYDCFLQKAAQLYKDYGQKGKLYLFYADFDQFKLINFHYGVAKADELLDTAIAYLKRIPDCLYSERLYSDRFVFIGLDDLDLPDEMLTAHIAQQMEIFLDPLRKDFPLCTLKICCGIYPMQSGKIVEILDNANLARLEAKRCGSCVRLLRKSRLQEIAEVSAKENKMMTALQEGRVLFLLQPKVDTVTGEIIGAEALAREIGTNQELISPGAFIPMMEENGAVIQLDFMILEQVCKDMRARLDRGERAVPTAVNISRLHAENPHSARWLHEVACQYGIEPGLLIFEMTESVNGQSIDQIRHLAKALRAYGYQISLDDFGSGYAGIGISEQMEFDELKLDKTFLSDDPVVKARNKTIIPGIIWMARKLHARVLCEGVEKWEQCRRLLEYGCHYVQGFYFSRPVMPDEFYRMYREQAGKYPVPLPKEKEE